MSYTARIIAGIVGLSIVGLALYAFINWIAAYKNLAESRIQRYSSLETQCRAIQNAIIIQDRRGSFHCVISAIRPAQ